MACFPNTDPALHTKFEILYVKNKANDWASQPDAPTLATRTVDTLAQKAEIEPLPQY